jgi:hypothetical protein
VHDDAVEHVADGRHDRPRLVRPALPDAEPGTGRELPAPRGVDAPRRDEVAPPVVAEVAFSVDGGHPYDGADPVLAGRTRTRFVGLGERVDRRRIEATDAVVQDEAARHHESAPSRERRQRRRRDRVMLQHGPEACRGRLVAERHHVVAASEQLGPDVDVKVNDLPVAVSREHHEPILP